MVQHGKILSLDNLKKRGFYITNKCCLYKENEENISHLFLECPFALKIWSMVWEKFGICWVLKENLSQFVENWDSPFYHPKLTLLWRIVLPHICWHIWKERNNIIFRNEEKPIGVVMGIMEKLINTSIFDLIF